MCPLTPASQTDIWLYWTDEELFTSLDRILKGSYLPNNVIQDVNPYLFQPKNLPAGIWYLTHSEVIKDSEHGTWKPKGETVDIFTSSALTGSRSTLEFYEGQIPYEQRTGWVMQEYRITQKGHCDDDSKPKDCRLLCRVFLGDKRNPDDQITSHHSSAEDTTSWNHSGSASASGSLAKKEETEPVLVAERIEDHLVEKYRDYILRGDYLEIDDLVGSPSSSSDNTSCLSLSSEEYFDSLALLRDIEQGKDASFKYTAPASAKSEEVIMHLPMSDSLNSGGESKFPAGETPKSDSGLLSSGTKAERMPKRLLDNGNKKSNEEASSSTSSSPRKSHVRSMKRIKKYFCFRVAAVVMVIIGLGAYFQSLRICSCTNWN